VPTGPLPPAAEAALERLFRDLELGLDQGAVRELGATGDARLAWVVSDLLRIVQLGSGRASWSPPSSG
jgi:hypothetical protein